MPNALAGLLGIGQPEQPPQPTKGLLGDVLPWAYSKGNYLRGLLSDPVGGLQNALATANTKAGDLNALTAAAAGEGMNYGPQTNKLAQLLAESYNPVGMTTWRGQPIDYQEAARLVGGKTEKVGGVNPLQFLDAAAGNGKTMSHGRVPLSEVMANEEGALYDGTVNAARAMEYARRPPDNVPPVLLIKGRNSGLFNVIDGGHRVSAARMRGDADIPAIVMERTR